METLRIRHLLPCLVVLVALLAAACDGGLTTSQTIYGVGIEDSSQVLNGKTRAWLRNQVPPRGVVPMVVAVAHADGLQMASLADATFRRIADTHADGAAFASRGLLVMAVADDGVVMVRAGTALAPYLRMKEATGGRSYLQMQEEVRTHGVDEVVPLMLQNAFNEVESLQRLSWRHRLLTWGGVPKAAPEWLVRAVATVYGMTQTWVLTFLIFSVLIAAVLVALGRVLPQRRRVQWPVYTLVVGLLVVPLASALQRLAMSRMEDVMTLAAHHTPGTADINWLSAARVGPASLWLLLLLGLMVYLRCQLRPQPLLRGVAPQASWPRFHHFESLLLAVLSMLFGAVLLSSVAVGLLATLTLVMAATELPQWLRGYAERKRKKTADLMAVPRREWLSMAAATALLVGFCWLSNPLAELKPSASADTETIDTDMLRGLYFVSGPEGQAVEGTTARLQTIDGVRFVLTVYSHMPTTQEEITYDADTYTFLSPTMGQGKAEVVEELNKVTIKFDNGWTLTK